MTRKSRVSYEKTALVTPPDFKKKNHEILKFLQKFVSVCETTALSLIRATENRFFAGSDRFLVCKTDSICIKRVFFGPKKHTLRIIYDIYWPNYLD